jgi:hypothetical protein
VEYKEILRKAVPKVFCYPVWLAVFHIIL